MKCKLCGRRYVSKQALIEHIGRAHSANIPNDWSPARYECYLRTGKTTGYCVYCKTEVGFNEKTGKYNRMCGSATCKKKARELAQKNYIGLHGKPYTIDDPEVQRKMVYSKKTSGSYIFVNEITGAKYKVLYDSSFGKDFFQMLDLLLGWDGSDVSGPSPHTYYYIYEGKKHFYVPDAYIHSLNLEVELKDGGDNPNTHPKIQAIDKVKESKKDAVMLSLKDQVNYIKICNKDYKEFFALLSYLNDKDVCELPKWESHLESSTYKQQKTSVAENIQIFEGRDILTAQKDKLVTYARLMNPDSITYDKLVLSYRNRLFHSKLSRSDWNDLYTELQSIELYMKKMLNTKGEDASRTRYETKRALAEIQQFINYMDDVGYRDCVTESVILSKGDIRQNFDKWQPKKGMNVLLITGLSGSGKTSTGYELAYNHNAELFQLDWIQHQHFMQDSPETPNYGLWQYVKRCCKKDLLNVEKAIHEAKTSDNLWHTIVVNVFNTILSFASMNTTKLFIVEGVQIPRHLHDYDGIEEFPIIIKGTSVSTSMFRRFKRSGSNDFFKTGNVNILKYYMDSEKYMNMFREQIADVAIPYTQYTQSVITFEKDIDIVVDIINDDSVNDWLELTEQRIHELVMRNKLIYHEELVVNGDPASFIMLVKDDTVNHVGRIVIATKAQYQHNKYASKLVERLFDMIRINEICDGIVVSKDSMVTDLDWITYSVNPNNHASIMFAHAVGFTNIYDRREDAIFYKLSKNDIIKMKPVSEPMIPYNISSTPMTEATFIGAIKDESRCYPVFVFLSYTHSRMSTFIKAVTRDPYAHSSISFDTSLNNMISFNTDGMVVENIHKDIYVKNRDIIRYSLYMYVATEEEYLSIRQFVNDLLDKQDDMRYNLLGLTNFIFGRGSQKEDAFFCSEFVSAAIAASNSKVFDRPPYMVKPYYFAKNKHFIFIKTGLLKNYDQKQVDKIVDKKIREGGYSDVEFDDTDNR